MTNFLCLRLISKPSNWQIYDRRGNFFPCFNSRFLSIHEEKLSLEQFEANLHWQFSCTIKKYILTSVLVIWVFLLQLIFRLWSQYLFVICFDMCFYLFFIPVDWEITTVLCWFVPGRRVMINARKEYEELSPCWRFWKKLEETFLTTIEIFWQSSQVTSSDWLFQGGINNQILSGSIEPFCKI